MERDGLMNAQQSLFDCSIYTQEADLIDVLSTNNQSGTLAEMAMAKEAIRRNYTVYFPIGHATKVDLIIQRANKRPVTIQVKKASYQKDHDNYKVLVGTGKPSCAYNKQAHGTRYKVYCIGDFDVLACYIMECDSFYFSELKDCLETATFRINIGSTPLNNWDVIERIEQ